MLATARLLLISPAAITTGGSIARTTTANISGNGVVAISRGSVTLTATATIIGLSGIVFTGAGSRTTTATVTGSGILGLVKTASFTTTTITAGAGIVARFQTASHTTTATITGVGTSMNFVTRDPATGYLMLEGTRFRFAGNNGEMAGLSESGTTYGETVTGGLHTMNHAAIDDFFVAAEGMNARVVRIFLSGMGVAGTFMPTINTYNHAALEGFDYAITKCQNTGIRIIAALVDDYDFYMGGKFDWCTLSGVTPDGTASQFFTNATVIANFKAYINAQLNHANTYTGVKYKDDPTFLAWETGNEISNNGSPQTLLDWTADIAQYIKVTVGAQQLVMDGKWGLLGPGTALTETHMNNAYIDIYTEHTYDQFRTPAHMVNEATIAHNYGKAFVWGEYPLTGLNQGGSSIGWTNADAIAAIEGNVNMDGGLFWSLAPQGNSHGGGFNTHYPGDDANMIARVTAQKNHAIAMAGATLTNATTPAKTATLVDTFTTLDTAKWTARSGATVTGGQASLPSAASGGSALSSAVKYDLSKSSIIVELVTKNPGTGSSGCGMYVQPTQAPYASNTIGFLIDGNTVKYRHHVGSANDTTETYNSTTHRWLRLRASANATNLTAYPQALGTIYWDVSTDGITWVNKRTFTPPALVLTSVYVVLYNENWGSDGTSGTAVFDNFNNVLSPAVITATMTGAGIVKTFGTATFTVTAGVGGGTGTTPYPSSSLYPSASLYPKA